MFDGVGEGERERRERFATASGDGEREKAGRIGGGFSAAGLDDGAELVKWRGWFEAGEIGRKALLQKIKRYGIDTLCSDFGAQKSLCVEEVRISEAGKQHAGEEGELEANTRTGEFNRR